MDSVITLTSKINNNKYSLYTDRITVDTGSETMNLTMPKESDYYICFHDLLYMGEKLYAVIACRVGFDVKYEIDEKNLKLINKTPYK